MILFIGIQALLIIAKSILNKLEVFKYYLPELQVEVFCYSTSRVTDLNLHQVINIFKITVHYLAQVFNFIILPNSSLAQRYIVVYFYKKG